jgi:hypothetical protein
VLRRIFESESEEVTRGWRKPYSEEEFHEFYSPNTG